MTLRTRTRSNRAATAPHSWSTWSRQYTATPAEFLQPDSEAAISAAVTRAANTNTALRVVGAGHSFTPAAVTDGIQLNLDHHAGLVNVDKHKGEVTLKAGTRLRDIPALLRPHGVALANQGDVDPQAVAGAVSTGTHGTGLGFTGFCGMLRSFRMVGADGVARTYSPTENAETFHLARLSLGTFGVLTEITLATVPVYLLVADERPVPFAEIADTFPERCQTADHLEFYWFPHTDVALVKHNTRLPLDQAASADVLRQPIGPVQNFIDEELINNGVHGLVCRLGRRIPAAIPHINRLANKFVAERTYVDYPHKVFVSPRRVRFNEMEYAVPLAQLPTVLAEIRRAIDASGLQISFPLEIRSAKADDVPLSTAYDRDSAYIAVHQWYGSSFREYFALLEPILRAAGGRPHWGKLHSLGFAELQQAYPLFDDYVAAREMADPAGLFLNDYTRRLFLM